MNNFYYVAKDAEENKAQNVALYQTGILIFRWLFASFQECFAVLEKRKVFTQERLAGEFSAIRVGHMGKFLQALRT